MNPLQFLVDLIPEKYRKYAVYGPAALVMLASTAILAYDAAVASWNASPESTAGLAIANGLATAAFALAYKNTDVKVEAE